MPNIQPAALVAEPAIEVLNELVITTSLNIAEVFGKQHKHVIRKIETLDCSEEFHRSNFGLMINKVEIGKGATRNDKAYNITRDGFVFLAMGFTGQRAAQFKEAYIAAFNRMEKQLRERTPMPRLPERLLMLIEEGVVVGSKPLQDSEFVTSPDGLAKLIRTEPYFSQAQLVDIIQAASVKLRPASRNCARS